MRRFEFWKLGLQNVLASATRSGLTVLGMSIGVAAILAVLTLGEAGRIQVKDEMARLGINQVQITAANQQTPLRIWDGAYLEERLEIKVDELYMLECGIGYSNYHCNAMLIGCTADVLWQLMPEVVAGNHPSAMRWDGGLPEVLVGQSLAEKLHMSQGEWFSADGQMLRCIGIVKSCQQATPVDMQQAIIVPAGLLSPLLLGTVQQLAVHVPADEKPDEMARKVELLFANERKMQVNTASMQVQVEAADSILFTFVEVLRWVALICMLVGGIGVANILLVSVRERRREIGVMQALGATGLQICGLFLCEALLYAVTGGILGLLGGGVLVAIAGKSIGLIPVIKAKDCTIVFLSAVFLGLAAGVAPALSASRMKPVDALRDD